MVQPAMCARDEVLEASAVVGFGAVARALARRMLELTDEQLASLRGVAGDGVVVALGPAEALPWVDGAAYLGRDPEAPRLLLPTMLRPALATALFERAVVARATAAAPPLAVILTPPSIVSVADALPIARARLSAWLEAAR